MRLNRFILIASLVLAGEVTAETALPFKGCFEIASRRYQVDMALLMAVAAIESGWQASARSSANAHGLMQIRWPLTARHLGAYRVSELYNPCLNIDLGARYLSELSRRYQGDPNTVSLMLAAYNYGPTRIRKADDIPDSVHLYVDKVLAKRRELVASFNPKLAQSSPPHRPVELIRFARADRATRFVETLKGLVPGAEFRVERNQGGESLVYLDSEDLSGDSGFRLRRLFPTLDFRSMAD